MASLVAGTVRYHLLSASGQPCRCLRLCSPCKEESWGLERLCFTRGHLAIMQTRDPAGAKAAAPCCLQSYISPKAATRSRPRLAATTRDIPGPAGARSPGVPELRPLPALWNPDLCPGEQEVCSSGRSVAEVQSVAPRWLPGGHCHEEDDNKMEKRYTSQWKSWKSEGSPAASSPCCSVPRAPSAQRSLAVVEAVMLNLMHRMALCHLCHTRLAPD